MKTVKGLTLDPDVRPAPNGRWPTLTLRERFWSKVDKSGGECWLWTGALNHRSYGLFSTRAAHSELAHRVSSVLADGPLPDGVLVLHRPCCTSKKCVRPDHLYRGDQKQNMGDALAAGLLHGRNVARGDQHYTRRLSDRVVRTRGGFIVGLRS